jgi:hypothetical protein
MRKSRSLNLILLLGLAASLLWLAVPVAAKEANCPLETEGSSPVAEVTAVDPPIELEVANQSDQVLNFGDGRGAKSDLVVLKATDPLPKTVKEDQFQLQVLQPMKRIGSDGLESTRLTDLTYSEPKFFDNRQRIKFSICANAEGGKSGTYTGQVLLSGPPGVASVTITQTAQLKSKQTLFLLFLLVALFLAGALLWWKTSLDLEDKKPKTRKVARIAIVAGSLISMGAAMYAVYNSNPAWGADLYASFAAVVGTGLAAAGLGSTVSGAVQQIAADAT